MKRHRRLVHLRERTIEKRTRRFDQAAILRRLDHSDDRYWLPATPCPEALPDRICIRPELPRDDFIDDRHGRRANPISVCETTATHDGHVHGAEVALAHGVDVRF